MTSHDGRWLAVRVRPSADRRDDVSAALFELGSAAVVEEGEDLVTQFSPETPEADVRAALQAAGAGASISLARIDAGDYSREWRGTVRAHRVGPLVIAPPWLAGDLNPRTTILIEPAMAFGTGEHATTRGVVRLMSAQIREGDTIADLGSGSAVLSIAAAKLGAARVAAIELDPDAIGTAEENVLRNGVKGRVTVIEGDATVLLPLVAPVRIIVANIISSVLLEILPVMSPALEPGGVAILGGILLEERTMMLQALGDHGWEMVAEDQEEGWWSVTIARR